MRYAAWLNRETSVFLRGTLKKKKERKSYRAEMLIVNGIDNDDLT